MNVLLAQRPPMPLTPLIVLIICTGASVAIFFALIRRWTSRRLHVALGRWCRENGYRFATQTVTLPPPVIELSNPDLRVQWLISSATTTLVQLSDRADPGAIANARWKLLIRKTIGKWPPPALRPVVAQRSAIELFSLGSFPMLPVNERFILLGTDMTRARELGESPSAGLLPADIGLLLHGEHLVLDFSSRHFDGIEFGRMIVLADQLERAVFQISTHATPA
jgi:hypothetical protein